MSAALLACVLGWSLAQAPAKAADPPSDAGAPAAGAPAKPTALPPWLEDLRHAAMERLPSPLGWVGVAGLALSGVAASTGLAIAGVASWQVMEGRRQQDLHDAAASGSLEADRARLGHLKASRDAFDIARVLSVIGASVLVVGLLGSLASATAVIVDETLFVKAWRTRHPWWSIMGPVLGTRAPPEMWPPVPTPRVPGVFTPPVDPPTAVPVSTPANPPASPETSNPPPVGSAATVEPAPATPPVTAPSEPAPPGVDLPEGDAEATVPTP